MEILIVYLGITLLILSYLALSYYTFKKNAVKGCLCLLPFFTPFFLSNRSQQDKKILLIALIGTLALTSGTSLSLTKLLKETPNASLSSIISTTYKNLSSELTQFKQRLIPSHSKNEIYAFWQDHYLYLVRNVTHRPPQLIKIHLPLEDINNLELNILPTDKKPGTTVHIVQASSQSDQGQQQLFSEGYTLGLKIFSVDKNTLQGHLFLDLPGDFEKWQGDLFIAKY